MCPISGHKMNFVFSEVILKKHKVRYYYCSECGFLKTEVPYWIKEAYSNPISDLDTGLVSRNIYNSDLLDVILFCFSLEKGRFIDFAGGYGLLTRLMRDKGTECYVTDRYCSGLFAKSFESEESFCADGIFAFEVLEHVECPVTLLTELIEKYQCKMIILSTQIFVGDVPTRDWWYYGFDEGQHISFYQKRTLGALAERLGMYCFSINNNYHIMSEKKMNFLFRFMISNKYVRELFFLYFRYIKK